jgi:phosphoribosyl-AMP cyclohydrolase
MAKEHTKDLLLDFGPDGRTLLPVVTQDSRTKDVLILAFVNREAFEETRRSGFATFWSRSRNELWKKGLTSGDMLRVDEIRINCEQNSLVYLVTPQGKGACHAKRPDGLPYGSCYYRRIEPDDTLALASTAATAAER